jgi:hypothetical protein
MRSVPLMMAAPLYVHITRFHDFKTDERFR